MISLTPTSGKYIVHLSLKIPLSFIASLQRGTPRSSSFEGFPTVSYSIFSQLFRISKTKVNDTNPGEKSRFVCFLCERLFRHPLSASIIKPSEFAFSVGYGSAVPRGCQRTQNHHGIYPSKNFKRRAMKLPYPPLIICK